MGDNIETKRHWSEAVVICKVEFATVVIYDRSRIGYRFCGNGGAIWLIEANIDYLTILKVATGFTKLCMYLGDIYLYLTS